MENLTSFSISMLPYVTPVMPRNGVSPVQGITAVPPTVLAALANPTAKASMVSAFVDGSTPARYEQRSSEVKSYVGARGE